MIASSIKAAVVKDNARQAGDTGSPEVQVALLTARINELMPHFKVAWNDAEKQDQGFRYLYLDDKALERFKDDVITEEVSEDGEKRHKIVTIIGNEDGLGVECLRGSGLIAGATSRAYNDIFTVTLVTCRSVGKS